MSDSSNPKPAMSVNSPQGDSILIFFGEAGTSEQQSRAEKLLSLTLNNTHHDDAKRSILRSAYQEFIDPGIKERKFAIGAYEATELKQLRDEEVPEYLFHRYRYLINPREKLIDDYPPVLQIEPSSICNFRCVFCYQTDKSFTRRSNGHMGTMDTRLFKNIIDQIEGNIGFITLASRGEPLLAKNLGEMLAYTSGKFSNVKLNTNASLLTEARAHEILSANVHTVVFSVDAAEEPLYSQLRVNGSLDVVYRNIEMFKEIKCKHYSSNPTITRVSGVYVDPEAQNLDSMKRFWSGLVDQLAFVQYFPWENIYVAKPSNVSDACSDLWRRMFVWWDGRVNPCDSDFRSCLAVGSVKESKISQLWLSREYKQLRDKHVGNSRGEITPCSTCTMK